MVTEGVSREGGLATEYSIRVSEHIRPSTRKGEAMADQPAVQYYFDRPFSLLFNTCFDAGFVLEGIKEPIFDESPGRKGFIWRSLSEIPTVLVARMRLPRR